MDRRLYSFLMGTAIALTAAWVGWSFYDSFLGENTPGDLAYHAANRLFEDGEYARALEEYEAALEKNRRHLYALRGKARTLMQLERYEESLTAFNEAVRADPDFGATYANRGILHDRMGRYRAAIADYEHALRLDQELADGPNWLTRFLRLQPEKPPTIEDRAAYLRAQLAKPEGERVLRVPELDRQQRPYKM
ncbi:MAG: tetratricopeptide repeat protein [Gammaproteobacteria bacterium]|nr:tetratricopeptide repeat protein [Gammaproteobacteria bacterium]NIR97541.1 tetratricopeptide repeat protein [Gammaproteobacteria bacterium]NIT63174.1 tetratricopeptide repeat protein [Gammaproteobacteria bacterium]NIV20124.1 tetratricopeptide repeat protein [Gammaproteobacteria bacterium]NIX11424.1 tetratricopeptide repeat protein [Gammaproteobacteria bacterium]